MAARAFILLTRGANNSRPDYTAPRCPTEQLSYSYSFSSRVDFCKLSEAPPPSEVYKSTRISIGLLHNFGGGGVCGAITWTEPRLEVTALLTSEQERSAWGPSSFQGRSCKARGCSYTDLGADKISLRSQELPGEVLPDQRSQLY